MNFPLNVVSWLLASATKPDQKPPTAMNQLFISAKGPPLATMALIRQAPDHNPAKVGITPTATNAPREYSSPAATLIPARFCVLVLICALSVFMASSLGLFIYFAFAWH
ncbi:MAG: hypothetical protein HY885_17275 [Deltaproteobacteria bacterium]|nr:hypothetical protein [Deltaproteobacteria bacterium]